MLKTYKKKIKTLLFPAAAFLAAACAAVFCVFAAFNLNITNSGNVIKSGASPVTLNVSEYPDMRSPRLLNTPMPLLFISGDVLNSGGSVAKYLSVNSQESVAYGINLRVDGTPAKYIEYRFSAMSGGGMVLAPIIYGLSINGTDNHMYGAIAADGETQVFELSFYLRDGFTLPAGSELTVSVNLSADSVQRSYTYVDGGLVYGNDSADTELFMAAGLYADGTNIYTVYGFSAQWSKGNRPAVLAKYLEVDGELKNSVVLADTLTYGIGSQICYSARRARLIAFAGVPSGGVQKLTVVSPATLSREVWNISAPFPGSGADSMIKSLVCTGGNGGKDYIYAAYTGSADADNIVVRYFDDGVHDVRFGGGKGYITCEEMGAQGYSIAGLAAAGDKLYISLRGKSAGDAKLAVCLAQQADTQTELHRAPFAGALSTAEPASGNNYIVLTGSGRAQLLDLQANPVFMGISPDVSAGRNIVAVHSQGDTLYLLTDSGNVYRGLYLPR